MNVLSTGTFAANAYKSQSAANNPKYSFKEFRSLAKVARDKLLKEATFNYMETFRELKKTWSDEQARLKADAMQTVHECAVNEVKRHLTDSLDDIVYEREKSFKEFLTASPDADMNSLLASLSYRNGSYSDIELQAYIEKFIGNYPAMKSFHDILDRQGFSFRMPIDADAEYAKFNESVTLLRGMIDKIDAPDAELPIQMHEFLSAHDGGKFLKTLDELDNLVSFAIKPEEISIRKKLVEAARAESQKAHDESNEYGLTYLGEKHLKNAKKIAEFIKENDDVLSDPAEKRELARKEAEELLADMGAD